MIKKLEEWFGFTFIIYISIFLIITFIIIKCFVFSKKDLDKRVEEKVEELKKQNSPHMIVVEPVSNEEIDLFIKHNGL